MKLLAVVFEILEFFNSAFSTMETWRLRHMSSMELARVNNHTLHDLGISDAQRFIEVNKPFWEK